MSLLFVILLNSVNSSDVGSGPLEQPKSSSFIISTLHPIFFNKSAAKFFAAPPPLSITILGEFSTLPMIFLASSTYVDFIFLILPIFDLNFS